MGPVAAAVYAVLAVIQLLAIGGGAEELRTVTQALIMPALLAFALAPVRDGERTVPLPGRDRLGLALAILLSWAGDVLPGLAHGDAQFVWRLFLFLLAQGAWTWELVSRVERSILVRARVLVLPYIAAAAIVISACIPGAAFMAGLLPLYATAVLATAMLATGLGPIGTIGGICFLIANGCIGLFNFILAFNPGEPTSSIVIMAAYMAAQGLVVWGVRRAVAGDARQAEAIIATADEDALAPPAKPSATSRGHLVPLPGPETRARTRSPRGHGAVG